MRKPRTTSHRADGTSECRSMFRDPLILSRKLQSSRHLSRKRCRNCHNLARPRPPKGQTLFCPQACDRETSMRGGNRGISKPKPVLAGISSAKRSRCELVEKGHAGVRIWVLKLCTRENCADNFFMASQAKMHPTALMLPQHPNI